MYRRFRNPYPFSNHRSWIIFITSTAFMLAFFWTIELAEQYFHWASAYEKFELDELAAAPVALTISLGVFFWHRSRALRHEVEQRTLLEEQLKYQANHDLLTGLPNRKYFLETLEATLKKSKAVAKITKDTNIRADVPYGLHRNGNKSVRPDDIVVLFLDLDGFKVVNDSSGHEAGDQMLLVVSERLGRCLYGEAFVARLGGDEFTVMLANVTSVSQVMQLIHKIQNALQGPILVDDCDVVITTSIGVAFASDTDWTTSELLRNADAAMYAAKRRGKSCYEFFDKEMNVKAKTHLSLESELRTALRQEQFRVYYQPIFHLLTNRVVGVEALVRWDHPQRGILTPNHFLDVAETSGLINDIGDFVFFEACRQVGHWQSMMMQHQKLYLSVNLSPRQFQHPAFVKQAKEIISQTAFPAENLHLEIIENMAMQNTDLATSIMRQLQTIGVNVALDDFGTGYSSLAYLRRFPLNGLKIDRSFVMELERHSENLTIVRAIIALTQAMGLSVTAEGIETASQLTTLSALGCTYGQGFYLARPMPATDMDRFLTKQIAATNGYRGDETMHPFSSN